MTTENLLRLRPQEDRRVRAGHLWVFNNEVNVAVTPIKGLQPGSMVRIEDCRSGFLGWGYVNPASLICARVLSRSRAQPDAEWVRGRLREALALRERLYPTPHYRLIFGEGDGLPGLVVDRYGDLLVAQVTTAGMEVMWPMVMQCLVDLLSPRGILLRNDTSSRELEGLDQYVRVAFGEVPEFGEVLEGDCRFRVPLKDGQKTGYFYDQRKNRDAVLKYVRGARVLDVFSYLGAWGVRAARAGAASVTCVDSSARAGDWIAENARINGVDIQVRIQDAFEALSSLEQSGELFDVVLLDPPAFIKKRKDQKTGMAAYEKINQQGLRLLAPGGILVSSSCSFHLAQEDLRKIVVKCLRRTDQRGQLLETGGQGPDHPLHPAIPETAYLKSLVCRVLPRD
jgi:23S rRNA (cytosine1962-C5)-methyltransferase